MQNYSPDNELVGVPWKNIRAPFTTTVPSITIYDMSEPNPVSPCGRTHETGKRRFAWTTVRNLRGRSDLAPGFSKFPLYLLLACFSETRNQYATTYTYVFTVRMTLLQEVAEESVQVGSSVKKFTEQSILRLRTVLTFHGSVFFWTSFLYES